MEQVRVTFILQRIREVYETVEIVGAFTVPI